MLQMMIDCIPRNRPPYFRTTSAFLVYELVSFPHSPIHVIMFNVPKAVLYEISVTLYLLTCSTTLRQQLESGLSPFRG